MIGTVGIHSSHCDDLCPDSKTTSSIWWSVRQTLANSRFAGGCVCVCVCVCVWSRPDDLTGCVFVSSCTGMSVPVGELPLQGLLRTYTECV